MVHIEKEEDAGEGTPARHKPPMGNFRERMVPGVGVELLATVKMVKLLILGKATTVTNHALAAVRYMPGTHDSDLVPRLLPNLRPQTCYEPFR